MNGTIQGGGGWGYGHGFFVFKKVPNDTRGYRYHFSPPARCYCRYIPVVACRPCHHSVTVVSFCCYAEDYRG